MYLLIATNKKYIVMPQHRTSKKNNLNLLHKQESSEEITITKYIIIESATVFKSRFGKRKNNIHIYFIIYCVFRYTEHGIVGLAQQWDQLNQLGMRIRHNLEQQIQVHWGSKIIGMRACSSQFSGNIIVGMFCPMNDFAIEKS